MPEITYLSRVKTAMRITHDKLNADIQSNIDAALDEMSRVGIDVSDTTKDLIYKGTELYCKQQYDYLGKGEQYRANFEGLCVALSMSEGYAAQDEDEDEEDGDV